jgi:hypothetical protein
LNNNKNNIKDFELITVMASLTESYLTYDNIGSPEPPKKNWIGAVYLCIEKSKTIKDNNENKNNNENEFYCYKFGSLEKAIKHYDRNNKDDDVNSKQMIIPICQWSPIIFHKTIIKYKLNKMYNINPKCNINNITIFRSVFENPK